MRVGVTERAEVVVVLIMSDRIPQGELDILPVNVDFGDIALEYSWNINLSSRTLN